MSAGDLITSLVIDPSKPLQGGVGSESRLVFILKADLASYTIAGIDIVTALTLAANKSAFVVEGIRQSAKPKYQRVATGSGQSAFDHIIELFYFDYSALGKANTARMTQGRYVIIAENAEQDANAIEVYGLKVGLECTELVRAPQENSGAIKITMSTPQDTPEKEAKPPLTFDAGTGVYATNRTAIDALLFLPTIGATGLSITTYPAATPTAIVITGTNFFANGSNSAVTKVELIDNLTGAVIPFTAALTVTNTTITTTTPVAVAAHNYKVKVTTTKGSISSAQNLVTT
jgi:hypothetical protein